MIYKKKNPCLPAAAGLVFLLLAAQEPIGVMLISAMRTVPKPFESTLLVHGDVFESPGGSHYQELLQSLRPNHGMPLTNHDALQVVEQPTLSHPSAPATGSASGTCICPDLFSPVCDQNGNTLASNVCEAVECLGLQIGSFSEEWCLTGMDDERTSGGRKSTAEECDCSSETDSPPVCSEDGSQIAINACEAVMCLGFPVDSFAEEWCPSNMASGASSADEGKGRKFTAEECDCSSETDSPPVCSEDGSQIAINACEAVMCLGFPVDSFTEEWCPSNMASGASSDEGKGRKFTAEECDCSSETDSPPVCSEDGSQIAINACEAVVCLGFPVDSFAEEWCPSNMASGASSDEGKGRKFTAEECDCSSETDSPPVCSEDGSQIAINACEAVVCLGFPVDSFAEEWCPSNMASGASSDEGKGRKSTAEECDCSSETDSPPVCSEDGSHVATNECEAAMCLGLPVDSFAEEWCGEEVIVMEDESQETPLATM